jgi:AcrR family transcriptional regulator
MGKQKYHHEDLRSVLVENALFILENSGMDSLTMRSLSRRIGVSRAAPYRHFEDKTTLLGAVAAEGFKSLGNLLEETSGNGVSSLELFRTCARAYVRFAIERSTLYSLMFGFELTDAAPVPELTETAERAFMIISDIIRKCQEDGVFKGDDPTEYANVTWSSLHGLSMLLIDGAVRVADDSRHLRIKPPTGRPANGIPVIANGVIETLVKGFTPRAACPF